MVVAELQVHLSRPIAPTRRVALGDSTLPVEHPPGFGGVLLAGVMARFAPHVDPDVRDEILPLLGDLRRAGRVPQPRLRHRFQSDRVGLQRARHRLRAHGERLVFDLDEDRGTPEQHVLAACYASAALPPDNRNAVLDALERAACWRAPLGPSFVSYVAGMRVSRSTASVGDPVRWAMDLLDLGDGQGRDPRAVQQAFRRHLRAAHPDHGGGSDDAAAEIAALAEARRILIG